MLTNEERRVIYYSETARPTRAHLVTADTPLEDLNLNWSEQDLPERERTKHVHRLHPYLGKFIPQLVEVFLRRYFAPGQTVLDPFVGSGTTLVQANELGINSVGYDVSAFNVLLCRAKTARYDLPKLRRELLDTLARVRAALPSDQLALAPLSKPDSHIPDLPDRDNDYLRKWYAPRALRELCTYRHYLERGDYQYRDLLRIVLSRAARSARLTPHFNLDFPKHPQTEEYYCHKHFRTCAPTTEAMKFLERYTLDTLRRIEQYASLRTNVDVTVHHEDSRTAAFPPVDGVMTSPPYVGLIDYHEQHAYAYHLLGLVGKPEWEIGPASNGSSQRAIAEYQDGIAEVFRRAAAAMPVGGPLVVVAGDRYNLYPTIAQMAGLQVEAILRRHVNRRTGRRANAFYESVFIWRKV